MDRSGVKPPSSLSISVFGTPRFEVLRLRPERLEAGEALEPHRNIDDFFKLSMGGAYCLPEGRTELLRQPRVAELPGSTSDEADPGLPGGRSPFGVKVIKELPGFSDGGFAKGGGAFYRLQQRWKSGNAFRPSGQNT